VEVPPVSVVHGCRSFPMGELFAAPSAVHPVPIYDGGAALVAVAVAVLVGRRFVRRGLLPPGSAGLALVGVYATARIAIETVRFHVAQPALLGATGWQVVFAGVALVAVAALWRGSRASGAALAATSP
jgi:prolipoprotein diacylglyceryltransferase